MVWALTQKPDSLPPTMITGCFFVRLSRQHCRLSICENWLSWTNTETAAATPPKVMQDFLKASAQ